MAGDWLKVETATPDKPEIWAIAQQLNIDPDAVVGKLFRVWAWFDQQTEDGNAPTVTKMLLDRKVGVTGFCDAVIESGWMVEDDSLTLTNFDRHNGQTAKNRALTAKRVAKHKKTNGTSVTPSVNDALPREEKRREENNIKDKPKAKRFVPPTLDDVRLYFYEKGERQATEPAKFHAYYESNGWMVGKNKMKSWQAAANGWISRNADKPVNKADSRAALTDAVMDVHNTNW